MEGHATVFFKQRNDVNVRQTRDCDLEVDDLLKSAPKNR